MNYLTKVLIGVGIIGGVTMLAGKAKAKGGDSKDANARTYGTAHQVQVFEAYDFYPQMSSWEVWYEVDPEYPDYPYPWNYELKITEGHGEKGVAATEAEAYAKLDAALKSTGYKRN